MCLTFSSPKLNVTFMVTWCMISYTSVTKILAEYPATLKIETADLFETLMPLEQIIGVNFQNNIF